MVVRRTKGHESEGRIRRRQWKQGYVGTETESRSQEKVTVKVTVGEGWGVCGNGETM